MSGVLEMARSDHTLVPDPGRVVARPFVPGAATFGGGPSRVDQIAERVLSLTLGESRVLLAQTRARFNDRHRQIESVWLTNFEAAAAHSERMAAVTGDRRLLLGAYFTQEYAFEAAALCNPSLVAHPGQPNPDGSLDVLMSLRAIGEGHISSIEFRSGRITAEGEVTIDPPSPYAQAGNRRPAVYEKEAFVAKLVELGADNYISRLVCDVLPERFGPAELEASLADLERAEASAVVIHETTHLIHWLASSNYELDFNGTPVSERIISPAGPADSRGMEDARFVRFTDDDGTVTYFATYTAFDGYMVLPQLIRTSDFSTFRIATLSGARVQNKGMAMFPRRLDGLYAALSRHDQESIYLMRSDHHRAWNHAEVISTPIQGWESVQIGNCGSPIELDEGWLVITHGVGPMRQYALGCLLLDLEDPTKVIGRMRQPLLEPAPEEREGYVPNVVYSCGGLVHNGMLVLPYGVADQRVSVATFSVDDLLGELI